VAIAPLKLAPPRTIHADLPFRRSHFSFSKLNSSHHSDLSTKFPFESNSTPSSLSSSSFEFWF
jgi:hypothetical protein